MRPEETLRFVVSRGLEEGASDVAASHVRGVTKMIRFSNNEVTVTKTWRSTSLSILFMMDGRVVVCGLDDLSKRTIQKSLRDLAQIAKVSRPNENYTPLPGGPFHYQTMPGRFDGRVLRMGPELVEYVETAIDASLAEGARRVAGALFSRSHETLLETSSGVLGKDRETSLELSVRAFVTDEASGHGVSCARLAKNFHPEMAGRRAAEIAKMARDPKEGGAGRRDVVFGPYIFANLLSDVVGSASAFNVDAGFSFFTGKLGERVASEELTLLDDGTIAEGLGSRPFDDEGVPTQRTTIIDRGVLRCYLHNSMTAKKFKTVSTGNAGWVEPEPWNIIVEPGPHADEELLGMVDDGLYITNNWYTRFQDYRKGDFSTIPRDGMFRIEGGEVVESLRGLRISDNMLRILQNIEAVSEERSWVRWWEVPVPTLTPHVLVRDVGITRSTK